MQVEPVPKAKKRRKPSTDKRAADELWSKLVRARGVCELAPFYDTPCDGEHQACHIVPRRYAATRTYLPNGLCACRHHHQRMDAYEGADKAALVDRIYGIGHYRMLVQRAQASIAGLGMTPLMFWREQRAVLSELWDQTQEQTP